MIRVAHVLNSPGNGGVPRVVHALVRHGDPKKVAQHLFYMKGGDGTNLFDELNIPVRMASSDSKAAAMLDLVSFLHEHRIDILHTHSYRPNLYARMAGSILRPSGLRIVAHYHNEYDDKWDQKALLMERQLAKITDASLAVSNAVADHVSERTGQKTTVVENGFDRDRVLAGCRRKGRTALGMAGDELAVGLIGRVCRQKGTDTFVDASISLAKQLQDAKFFVIGNEEDRALAGDLRAKIAAAGMEEQIRFTGHRDDMCDVLAGLDLITAPSRWEGFGLVLAEAMAVGIPVIASRVGGIPSVVGDAAVLIEPDDTVALVDAVSKLSGDPRNRARMRAAGFHQASRFDWKIAAEKVEDSYARIGARS